MILFSFNFKLLDIKLKRNSIIKIIIIITIIIIIIM